MTEKDLSLSKESSNVGLGVDVVSIARMRKILGNTPSFAEFTFTEDEIKYCMSYPNRSTEHFATHFAAKEAVLKALGKGFFKDVKPTDVEVSHNSNGKPFIITHGAVKKFIEENDIVNIPISLTFTNNDAVSVAIALKKNDNIQGKILKKTLDPTQLLTKQFKEAKKIFDDSFNKELKDE